MDTSSLKEYRCTCGKLLFKGHIVLSVIEIKCKRCGTVCLVREPTTGFIGLSLFAVLIDGNGTIISTCNNTLLILGYSQKEITGKQIAHFCPPLKGDEKDTRPLCVRNAPKPFTLMNNAFMHHDGHLIPLESHFVCDYENGIFSGYRMFNWLGKGSGL